MKTLNLILKTVLAVAAGLGGVTYLALAHYYGAGLWGAVAVGVFMTLCLCLNYGLVLKVK